MHAPLSESVRTKLERRLLALWFDPAPTMAGRLAIMLMTPLAWLAGRIASKRRKLIHRLPASHKPAVIVVGNLLVGGTGKTPAVIALAREMSRRGRRVGMLVRGYRAHAESARIVSAESDALVDGDEPVLLASETGLPVAAAIDRARALELLETTEPDLDIVIADDGLQHVGLARTLEIAIFDTRGIGNARLLPAGPLREPIGHGQAMDAFLLNGEAQVPDGLAQAGKPAFRFEVEPTGFRKVAGAGSGPGQLATADFANFSGGREIAAIAGIGRPARFFDILRAFGLRVREYPLADHARIDPAWLASLDAPLIVMTAKDAVKCRSFADDRCWLLDVRAHFDPAVFDWLEERLSGSSTA